MTPLTLNLLYLVESGSRITLVGKSPESGEHAAIAIDLRPCAAFWAALEADCPDQVAYAADGVQVSLAFEPTGAPDADTSETRR